MGLLTSMQRDMELRAALGEGKDRSPGVRGEGKAEGLGRGQ